MTDMDKKDRREAITSVIFSAQQDTAALQTPDIPDDVYWMDLAAAVYLALDEGGHLAGSVTRSEVGGPDAAPPEGVTDWVDVDTPYAQMPDWAKHLAPDAPSQRCSDCGRNTWSAEQFGKPCGMTQPSGQRCRGTFGADR